MNYKDIQMYISDIKKLFYEGFYFSYTYDLTLSKIKIAYQSETESKFMWNYRLFQILWTQNINKKWLLPLIQGFIGHFSVFVSTRKLDYYLISRRAWNRGGTRYNDRGVDDDGNVANFVESEQIVYYNKYCFSHLQIRGSVPLFWEQKGITAKTKITRSLEMANSAFLKHLEEIAKTYQRVLCVNLMARSKKDEQMLTEGYEELIRQNNIQNVRYEYFDFHHACKGEKFDQVNPLITKLQLMNENFRFYAEDLKNGTIYVTQKGVIRTNCLDCLDRTNYFITKTAAIIFRCQMAHLGIDINEIFGTDFLTLLDSADPDTHPFIQNFKNIWADNGDYISRHYTGTNSTHTNITRQGKRNIQGFVGHKMVSIGRFYKQNVSDHAKQQAINMFLGADTEIHNYFTEAIEKELKIREPEYTSKSNISIYLVSWNLTSFNPPESYDISADLLRNSVVPDILVFSFQEVASYELDSISEKWEKILSKGLESLGQHYLVVRKSFSSTLLTIIFAKEEIKSRITQVQDDTVKLGMLGRAAIVTKLEIDDSSFGFINFQLEPGSKNTGSKVSFINDIHLKAFQQISKSTKNQLKKLDFKFFVCDTNFKINLSDLEVRKFLESYTWLSKNEDSSKAKDILATLLSNEEAHIVSKYSQFFSKYKEGEINFLPNSRYEPYSTLYSNSHTPGWSNRIMLWASKNSVFTQNSYNRCESMESESRPIYAQYNIEVKVVDDKKKEDLIRDIHESLMAKPDSQEEEIELGE